MFPGGRGLNQSIAVARAGSEIYHAGKVGQDGKMLIDMLNQNGVCADFIGRSGSCTGHAVMQLNKHGNNCTLLHAGGNQEITTDEIDRILDHFNPGDIIMIQNEISNIPYIVDKASNKYMKIVLNPSPMNNTLKELDLGKISYLILNEVEGEEYTGETNPSRIVDSLLDRHPHLKVVLTLGRLGAIYGDELVRIQQSAYLVDSVDYTAAGDTFLGYFISRISMGAKSWNALRIAALAAALAITKEGAAISIPSWKDVMRFASVRDKESRSKEKVKLT